MPHSISPNAYPNQPLTPHSSDIAAALVLADGNIDLVAEQYRIPPSQVLQLISDDPLSHDLMARQFRTRALIKQFEVLGSLTEVLASKIAEMRSDHLIQAFKALSASFATLSASGQVAGPASQTLNINERVLSLVPSQVREALRVVSDISPEDLASPDFASLLQSSPNLLDALTPDPPTHHPTPPDHPGANAPYMADAEAVPNTQTNSARAVAPPVRTEPRISAERKRIMQLLDK